MLITDALEPCAWTVAMALAPVLVPWLVFGALEQRLPAGQLKNTRDWWFDAKLALVYRSVPIVLSGAIVWVVEIARHFNGGRLIDLASERSAGAAVVVLDCLLYIAVWDFFYYWWHRAQHHWPALWAMHKLHHLDERLGVTTQMRVHWLEEIGRIPAIFLPMALLFDLPVATGLVAMVLTVWTAFIHANLRLSLGWLGVIVVGPQVHRIHHSTQPGHADRNFSALFPIYDVLFGTYHHPRYEEFPSSGISGEADVKTLKEAAWLPFYKPRLLKGRQRPPVSEAFDH